MNIIKTTAFAVTALAMGFAAEAQAGVITYDLDDTAKANNENVVRGFGGRGQLYSFDTDGAGATLSYDQNAGTVSIAGTAVNIKSGESLDFNVLYDDVVRNGDTLTLNDMNTVGDFGGTTVQGKGFNLTIGDTLRGDGWLLDANTGEHFGDFHFAGTETTGTGGNGANGQVPVPSPLALIAAMALFFGLRRRRRSAAA